MRVLGIDPGTRLCGWGVVERQGTRLRYVGHGVVKLSVDDSLGERLVALEEALAKVVDEYGPAMASIEALFFAKDAQAAAKLGHARGVALLVCARQGLDIVEYPPARVKRAIAGNGRAEKMQVANMIRVMLGLTALPPLDASDALALAVTCLQASPLLAVVAAASGADSPRRLRGK